MPETGAGDLSHRQCLRLVHDFVGRNRPRPAQFSERAADHALPPGSRRLLWLDDIVPIDTRLSNALLDFHKKGEDRVPHQELAVELGTAREVVSRRLKQFESEGWIRLSRGRITVSDRNGLQQLGEPRYLD